MKTQKRIFRLVLLFLAIGLSCVSCSKDEPITPTIEDTDSDGIVDSIDKCPNVAAPGTVDGCPVNIDGGELEVGAGVNPEDLNPYQGDIGIVVDAREIAKKGYKPVKVMLDIDANSGDYSQTINLNEFALMGQILLTIEDLSEAALEELQDGVQVEATVLDEVGSIIWSESLSKLSFQSNPLPSTIKANGLADLNTDVDLIPNTPYYIQRVVDGVPSSSAVFQRISSQPGLDSPDGILSTTSTLDFTGDEDNALFYFEEVPDKPNHFNIKHVGTNSYLKKVRRLVSLGPNENIVPILNVVETGHNSPQLLNHQFIIRKVNSGEYRMTDAFNVPIQVTTGVGLTLDTTQDYLIDATQDITFRFVPMNIDWKIENISGGTEYLQPILPAATTNFSFNSTLINCGQGSLEQSIESAEAKTTTTTVGWEESVSITSTHSAGATVAMGLEVEGKFFGNGAKYSADISASYDYTNTNTTTNTNWQEATGTTTRTHLTTRTVTVPAKTAVLVYDVFQSYVGVKVNVVRRLRVKANEHDSGVPLTGEQISTQFHFNNFQGHISEVGADYVEITLRGVATMDEIFESQSDVQEVDPMCSN